MASLRTFLTGSHGGDKVMRSDICRPRRLFSYSGVGKPVVSGPHAGAETLQVGKRIMSGSNKPGQARTTRSLDHFLLVSEDLEQSSRIYQRLGFRVMNPMEHVEIGTSNVIVQFPETYLEIVGDFDNCQVPPVAERVVQRRALGEGYWMTSLTSSRLEDEAAPLREAGLDPQPIVSACRRVRLPGSGWIDTDSRSTYVWHHQSPLTSLFLSDHRRPEAIWIPDYQCHPNSAAKVLGVRYVSATPLEDLPYFATLFGGDPSVAGPDAVTFLTPRNEFCEILSPAELTRRVPSATPLEPSVKGRGASITFGVADLARCRWALYDNGVPFREERGLISVSPPNAGGVVVEFSQT